MTAITSDFVRSCYLQTLGREPDAAGLAWWCASLDKGDLSRSQLLRSFLSCDERLANPNRPYSISFEPLVERLYRTLLTHDSVAVDVGAHSGRHSVPLYETLFGKVGSIEQNTLPRLHLVEPIPPLAAQLTQLFASSSPAVSVHCCALSDVSGTVDFAFAVDRPEESSLRQRHRYNGTTRVEHFNVEVRKFDDLLGHLARLDFIKIDVEGAEFNLLVGAAKAITSLRPVVAFESGGACLAGFGFSANDIFDFFETRNYLIFDILGTLVDKTGFAASLGLEHVWDYVATPRERADAVRHALCW